MKKDSFFSFDNLAAYFPKEEKFTTASLKLLANGYIELKKEDEIKKVNITEKGVFAATSNLFLKTNSKLIWAAIKDYGMLTANLAVAAIALLALNQDNSKFVHHDEIKELNTQLKALQSKVDRLQIQTTINSKITNDTAKKPLSREKIYSFSDCSLYYGRLHNAKASARPRKNSTGLLVEPFKS